MIETKDALELLKAYQYIFEGTDAGYDLHIISLYSPAANEKLHLPEGSEGE